MGTDLNPKQNPGQTSKVRLANCVSPQTIPELLQLEVKMFGGPHTLLTLLVGIGHHLMHMCYPEVMWTHPPCACVTSGQYGWGGDIVQHCPEVVWTQWGQCLMLLGCGLNQLDSSMFSGDLVQGPSSLQNPNWNRLSQAVPILTDHY